MLTVDHWSFKCARCDWKAMDEFTVNAQPSVAEALVRRHINAHEARETVTAHGSRSDAAVDPVLSNQAPIRQRDAEKALSDLRASVQSIIEEMQQEACDACSLYAGTGFGRCETCGEHYFRHRARRYASRLQQILQTDDSPSTSGGLSKESVRH
jgi:hypothetical protein